MSAVIDPLSGAPTSTATRWGGPLLVLGLVLGCLLFLYRDTLIAMVGIWQRSETFAHCFLVPPISLWLIWRDRARLKGLSPRPQPWLLLGLAGLAFFWLLSDMAGVNAATQFAFTALLVLSVPAVLGLRVAREMAFPLGFLFFMVPVGEFLMPQFMEWTADFTVAALQFSGIPVYREGLNFVIPSGSWSVVEACSGIRYMIASFMVGSLFAYLNYSTLRRRLIFCAVSLLVPLVANWLRAYLIVMLGHFSGNTLAVGVDHLIYGWLFFGIVIGIMFMIGARWSQPPAAPRSHAATDKVAATAGPSGLALLALAAATILALPHVANWRFEQQRLQSVLTPLALSELPGAPAVAEPVLWEPVFLNPSSTAVRGYAFGDGAVVVHVAYYRYQGYGRKLVSSQNVLLSTEDKQWRRVSSGTATHGIGGQPQVWRSAELAQGQVSTASTRGRRLDVRQIYWVDGQFTASNARASLYALAARLLGRGDDGAMITLYTEGDPVPETAARLDRFIAQHGAAIEAQLTAYRARR